jgi:glycosyltransferase involved in cell wall biosynthesis
VPQPATDAIDSDDTISVIIPSSGRGSSCRASISSALGQTLPPLEVIVVVDGDPDGYGDLLADLADDRVRVLWLDRHEGPSGARNAGVRAARGQIVAFLDDDDVWLPHKLQRQVATIAAVRSGHEEFVSSTAVIAVSPSGRADRWPGRDPLPRESVADFLVGLGRRTRRNRVLQTSTFVASAELARRTPMHGATYEDWEWLIRASRQARWVHLAEPLTIYALAPNTLSSRTSLAEGEAWLEALRPLLTDQAYAAACLTILARRGAALGGSRDLRRICCRSFQGRPGARQLLSFPFRVARIRLAQRWRTRGPFATV